MRRAVVTAGALALLALPSLGRAQVIERFYLHGEAGGGVPLGDQADRFGPGAFAIARLGVTVVGPLSVQLTAGNWWFVADEGPVGRLISFEGGVRLAPRVGRGALGGPVFDANAGFGLTGDLERFTFDVGAGWEFALGRAVGLGPVVRYVQIVQPDGEQHPADARLLTVGAALTLRVPPSTAASAPPPPDGDGDGVPDGDDRCPAQPEDLDRHQDGDGCPDEDDDGDGVADGSDRCPAQPETVNNFDDGDGCPDRESAPPPDPAVARPAGPAGPSEHTLDHAVHFPFNSHRIPAPELGAVGRVCEYVRAHPDVQRIQIGGYADERGSPAANQELSAYRAAAVARALVNCGAPADRIESSGFGATRRFCTDSTPECHRLNRRVVFVVFGP